jgi:hypothetical protein
VHVQLQQPKHLLKLSSLHHILFTLLVLHPQLPARNYHLALHLRQFLLVNVRHLLRLLYHEGVQVETDPHWLLLALRHQCAFIKEDSPNGPIPQDFHQEVQNILLHVRALSHQEGLAKLAVTLSDCFEHVSLD